MGFDCEFSSLSAGCVTPEKVSVRQETIGEFRVSILFFVTFSHGENLAKDMFGTRLMSGVVVLTLIGMGTAQVDRFPKPQVESAEGQLAPDFTLRDQSGKAFRLSALRGGRGLLIFYRGYW